MNEAAIPAELHLISPAPASPRPLVLEPHGERASVRWLGILCALLISAGFFAFVYRHFAPGPSLPGIDENAYLVAGKNLATHFTPGFKPESPYAFVGPMWIRTQDGWFYPKYPIGVPLLNAVGIWIGGGAHDDYAYFTSPVCAALAVLAMFFFTRALAGTFFAALGAILLATNSTVLQLALVPSSHAPALAFSLWGMVALLAWWRGGNLFYGTVAGLLLGFTVAIRYSEGLFILPVLVAAVLTLRWRSLGSWIRASVPLIAWAIPVGALVIYNFVTVGHVTGYDSTNESTGFTIAEFRNKWEYTIQQLHLYGLFFMLPVGILGMLLMLGGRFWRVGLMLLAWVIPMALLYNAYYWGQQVQGLAFLRFFLTLYPPVIAAGMWVIAQTMRSQRSDAPAAFSPLAGCAAAGVFVAIVSAVGIYVALPEMHRQLDHNTALDASTRALRAAVPGISNTEKSPRPVLFGEDGGLFSPLLMHLQFVGDGEWFGTGTFSLNRASRRGGLLNMMRGRRNADDADPQDDPVLVQVERITMTEQLYRNKTQDDLSREQAIFFDETLAAGRPIYAVLGTASTRDFKKRLEATGFAYLTLSTWKTPGAEEARPPDAPPPPDAPREPNRRWGGGRRGGGGPPGGQSSGLRPSQRLPNLDGAGGSMELIQITGRRPATQPTTTTRPATQNLNLADLFPLFERRCFIRTA